MLKTLNPLELGNNAQREFINGYSDSEGHVSNCKYYPSPQGPKPSRRIVLHNSVRKKQQIIQQILKRFEVDSVIRPRKTFTKFSGFKEYMMYDLAIENIKSFKNFKKNFHFSANRKQKRLEAIIKSYGR
jgi:intein-encoded DNA endonuclease-like protein